MIDNEGCSPERSISSDTEAKRLAAQSYRQKIVARQCLNKLVDIKTALSRQNKLLEILIGEMKAARIDNHAK
ncbi:MAG: hypothetical protein AB8G77_15375 [Rhodothermales bacterium]